MAISEEFGKVVMQIIGKDSQGKAELKTGISRSYWVYLCKGKVPRPEALEKIIDGYKPSQTVIRALYTAAGYEIPSKYQEPIPQHLKTREELIRDFVYEMRSIRPKCKESDEIALRIFEETLEAEAQEHINGEPEI